MEWVLGVCWAAFLLAWFVKRSSGRTNNSGHDIKTALNRLEKQLTIIHEIPLPVQGGMGKIDFAAVSPHEVFVASIIQSQGKIRGDINSREWLAGKETIYNPVWRNRLLLNGLEPILKETHLTPLIVFANGILADDFGPNIIEFKNLEIYFKKRKKAGSPNFETMESAIETLIKLKEMG